MWKLMRTIALGRKARAEQAIETANAAVIIEQKLREAESSHGRSKRALASLIVTIENEERALAALDNRLAELTDRTRSALEAGDDDLAASAAELVAQLENERRVRQDTLDRARSRAARMRLSIERTHRKLVDLRQGLITARAVERERQSLGSTTGRSTDSALAAIREGEAVLQRLMGSEDPVGVDAQVDRIEDELSGRAVEERLADAGHGDPLRVRAQDVLSRLKADTRTKTTKAKTAG